METEAREDPLEVLLQAHKKEKKELQGKIQGLKKSATKGDKKKKKEVQEEINKLEFELSNKHKEEISKLKEKIDCEVKSKICERTENLSITVEEPCVKITKAQKRRDKKAAEQKEREKRILEQELLNETGVRNVEMQKINEELKKRGLMIFEIEADGNCLYNAIDHQLNSKFSLHYGVKQLRVETSNHIRENMEEYLPFLSDSKTGDIMTKENFDVYCNNIKNTTNWGGQVELRALSQVIKKPITVIQADGPPLTMGEEYNKDGNNLIVTYHRHMYQLGEHYNSVQPYVKENSDESPLP